MNDQALLQALDQSILSGAAIDVLHPEPPYDLCAEEHDYSHPYLEHPAIMVSPHIAASTVDAQKRIAIDLAQQIRQTLN